MGIVSKEDRIWTHREVDACNGCNKGIPMTVLGYHLGSMSRCIHILDALVRDNLNPEYKVFTSKISATRYAKKISGGLTWVSSGPVPYWIVSKAY